MLRVFVDTAAWLAHANADDALHVSARQNMAHLRQQGARLLTTEFVLLEVADALASPKTRVKAAEFINGLRQWPVLDILPAGSSLLADGWGLYTQRPDKAWSLTDCISFSVMTRYQVTQAFTSDHHFEQAGFVKLLQV